VLYEKYKGLDEFAVEDAWEMNYTGSGVKVGLIDRGIDFATPDLIGTQAQISDVNSPYYGWPIVIDLKSLASYQQDHHSYDSQYADTTSTNVNSYNVTGTSKSGKYHIGDHPDHNLAKFYGNPVKVLVVDESEEGIYDTVYVDLNNNRDFGDDKPCRKGDEISYWDRDDDDYPDESGGMIYFIADGKTPLPLSKMFYGEEAKIPGSGELVAFHFDSSSHGTMCASTIVAQGKNVKGIAPGAKLIPVRNLGFNDMLLNLLASLGYDGVPNTGDEANVVSRSGELPYLQKGADETSAFLEYLTTAISPNTTIVYANGNLGSGYGTCGSPCSEHVINAGAMYDLWWNESSYRGDVTCFSARGPNALGQVKPNVLATGYYAPESKPLWRTHSGKASWDAWGGGTSDATPHVAAVVALIYQAYKDTYGDFPSSEKARDILMSSATNIDEDVFAQGSGIINAKRAVEIASGENGILIEPALLATPPVKAGSELEFKFNVTNYSGENLSLKPQKLVKKNHREFVLKSEDNTFLTIPADMLNCDLLKVSSYYSRNANDTKLPEDEGYDLYLYDWADLNKGGKFETNFSMQNASYEEFEPIAIGTWGSGFTSEVRMHNPNDRIGHGLVVGIDRKGATKSDELNLVMETYDWEPWEIKIDLNDDQGICTIPVPNATGVYGGRILLEYGEDEQCIPLSFAAYKDDDILIADGQNAYENDKIYGRFEGDGTHGFWDSRYYPFYHQGEGLAMIEVSWDDPYTDLDVYFYGEGAKDFSSLWDYSTEPPVDLPKLQILKDNGHSMRAWKIWFDEFAMGTGYGLSYNSFHTTTRENREVIVGHVSDGLNLILLNEVIFGGNYYGENVSIKTEFFDLMDLQLESKAGDLVTVPPEYADSIKGFSMAEELVDQKTFRAQDGDLLLLQSNESSYSPHLFFDTNGNGTLDWDEDEVVFADLGRTQVEPTYTDVISIIRDGTYFLRGYGIAFYHLKEQYELNSDNATEIRAPEKAGTYLGLAVKNGVAIPVPITLKVMAKDPASIDFVVPERTKPNSSFEAKLEVIDSYGNLVDVDSVAEVEFLSKSNSLEIMVGEGFINLTAPEEPGMYKIKAECKYGSIEKEVQITTEAIDIDDKSAEGSDDLNSSLSMGSPSQADSTAAANTLNEVLLPKVESISAVSNNGTISIFWNPVDEADHYNVYQLRYNSLKTLAEVKDPQYTMVEKLWSTYTFRIAAVDESGNEGPLSDPVGIVAIP